MIDSHHFIESLFSSKLVKTSLKNERNFRFYKTQHVSIYERCLRNLIYVFRNYLESAVVACCRMEYYFCLALDGQS